MYTLVKIHDNKFRMIEDRGPLVIEGDWSLVSGFCEYKGFIDLDSAKEAMELRNHNAANFGAGKSFIFSFDNKRIPKLKIVS